MLLELNIKDLAIIDSLSISFSPGMNVFTGETGAGKSIIIDAIDLILGDRAAVELIRTGADEARVEALFDAPKTGSIAAILESSGIPRPIRPMPTNPADGCPVGAQDGVPAQLLISRTLARSGRNKIFINNSLSTLVTLTEAGSLLIDICGQSAHQSLLKTDEHMELLDNFAMLKDLKGKMAASYAQWTLLKKSLDAVIAQAKRLIEERDLLEFQVSEITDAGLKEGEDEELKKQRERLRNSERLFTAANESERVIYSDNDSVIARLGSALKALKDGVRHDERLSQTVKRLEGAYFELEDVGRYLRDYSASIENAPDRLEEIEARLNVIEKLKKKYGPAISDVLKKSVHIAGILKNVEGCESEIKTLGQKVESAKKDAEGIAGLLSKARHEKARELKKGLEREMNELGMKGATFEVVMEEEKNPDGTPRLGEKGFDKVSFRISTNPGEELKALSRIASGGELSRLMLAIKNLTSVGKVPTLIFDEVDSGIGSVMAGVVGRKLKKVSRTHQVICITHLAQIAAYADCHYHVEKVKTKDQRTVTRVKKLSSEERIVHIAGMLAGSKVTDTALRQARELLKEAG